MTKQINPYIQIHAAVFLFGLTAILGGLIQMDALMLVWWRVFLTSISLLFLTRWGRDLYLLDARSVKSFAGVGVLMGLHWLCFYGSIKLANASISLITMATVSLFTAFIEPWLMKRKINKYEVLTGLAVIPGMILIAQHIDVSLYMGFLVGLISALLAAIFTTLNKKYMSQSMSVFTVTFIEMISACLFLGVVILVTSLSNNKNSNWLPPSHRDWMYIIFLALFCTTIAQALNLSGLKLLSTFSTNLVNNLEPIYGIILAAFILHEYQQLNTMFYVGAAMILSTVIFFPKLKNYQINES